MKRASRNSEQGGPVFSFRCPIHGNKVSLDGERRPLGKCWGCALEAEIGIAKLRSSA